MKTNLMHLLACLCLLTLITACDKKETIAPEPSCKLLTRTEQHYNSYTTEEPLKYIYSNSYDVLGNLTFTEGNQYFEQKILYKYDESGRLILRTSKRRYDSFLDHYEYSYNTKGQVEKLQHFLQQDISGYPTEKSLYLYYNYFYDESGKCIKIELWYPNDSSQFERIRYYSIQYKNGQPSTLVEYNVNGNYTIYIDFVFDGKRVPEPRFTEDYPEYFQRNALPYLFLFDQNIISCIYTNESRTERYYGSYTASYKYNELGYPIESKKTELLNGNSIVNTFDYSCE
ncbi:hypothetical protein ACSX1A_06030 [Pontibacter sp. MBLB2868]|uniref:hypothetical protein n=1 Tax=Pontibacter sp. MBLB2868 TaxID=3451555 RepID=UPI003F756E5F